MRKKVNLNSSYEMTPRKARLLILTHTVKITSQDNVKSSTKRKRKWVLVQETLEEAQELFKVQFEKIADGVYITKQRHYVGKLRQLANFLQTKLPNVTIFFVKQVKPTTVGFFEEKEERQITRKLMFEGKEIDESVIKQWIREIYNDFDFALKKYGKERGLWKSVGSGRAEKIYLIMKWLIEYMGL